MSEINNNLQASNSDILAADLSKGYGYESSRGSKIDLHEFMERNFRSDMSMTEFARASGRSLSTFKRDFKKMSPLSPERWLTDRRLRASYDMLARGLRVSDVCFDVGFKNVSHFSAIFKKKFGCTPGEVRKANKNKN